MDRKEADRRREGRRCVWMEAWPLQCDDLASLRASVQAGSLSLGVKLAVMLVSTSFLRL